MTESFPEPDAEPVPVLLDDPLDPPAVLVDATREGLVVLTLNRPNKKNAFGPDLIIGLSEIFETLHGSDHVRAVFIRGAGGAFSAGADLDWMAESADWMEDDNRDDAMRMAKMFKALHDLPQLTVALVEGIAFGGGAGLVAACDFAVAEASSIFAFSEVKLGLIPATISPYVVKALGERTARMLFATGRKFTADQALAWGLVHEVVADGAALQAVVDRLCVDVGACAPDAVRAAKRLVGEVADRKIDHGLLSHTAHAIAHRRSSDEGREGVAAFLERRPPKWSL
jgi:methylglutaconyl-CoA hydratase